MLKNIPLPKRKSTKPKLVTDEKCEPGSRFVSTVKDITADGQAIVVHPSGRICFTGGVWIGEQAEFEITELGTRDARAKVLHIIHASTHRVEPKCLHHGFHKNACGGCPWQFIDYKEQLIQKQTRVIDELGTIFSKKQMKVVRPIIRSQHIYQYRNRAQFKTDGKKLGFVSHKSNNLVDVVTCPILCKKNQEHLTGLREGLPNPNWTRLIASKKTKKERSWLSVNVDDKTAFDCAVLDKRLPFRQGNTTQNDEMKKWLFSVVNELDHKANVIELFCGSGNFTGILLKAKVKSICAVEGEQQALDQLKLHLGAPDNLTLFCSNLYEEKGLLTALHQKPNAELLVVDPPRAGLKHCESILKKLKKLKSIVYISCDLATFKRDSEILAANGFTPRQIQPLDQFPHTPHIEILSHFSRSPLT